MRKDSSVSEGRENKQRRKADVQQVIQSGLSSNEDGQETGPGTVTEESQTNQGRSTDTSEKTSEDTVKDRKHFSMYVGTDVVREVNDLYNELNNKHEERFGVKLPKNKRFYPALLRHGMNSPEEIKSELHLD
ncbi:hypothetical protein [Haloferax prahovense]|uniref:hypothetical protein n=1 Tax=Haloferax prahovense TaxID=381852 RepID=UPI0012687F38|nr:hypothetical protein [Haloferax prahovense]